MVKSKKIEVFDLLLKDIMDSHALFDGKVVVFGGDFRQTLHLTENMRIKSDPAFCKYLMRIGNGIEKVNCDNKIEIPDSIVIPFTFEEESLDELLKITYLNVSTFFSDSPSVTSPIILTIKNDFIDELNDMLIAKFSFTTKKYVAIDETVERTDQSQFEDFLHTLNPPGLLSYKLTLKKIIQLY
ncbi:uncharacterized protein LOC142173632 [Nicotiana tabacum]|uniref:Uncharacterized protein LOC142173632 n=1 Tax=Nicotiana tabacum TaxID=4097 RepID=A0AC58TDP7_TOBAC